MLKRIRDFFREEEIFLAILGNVAFAVAVVVIVYLGRWLRLW